ncbi:MULTISPECIES: hypothetical protein [Giesbergeria]|uniref:Uncharacterized protein n=1 Tax=Giesbergeria sinuosa TaxID=80883 RepID=A0ABV9QCD8_9BURK
MPPLSNWFETLTGFAEVDYHDVQRKLQVQGQRLISLVNQRSFGIGYLETPTLAILRERALPLQGAVSGELVVRNTIANAYALHTQPETNHALIQVASQFNLLEMTDYRVTPEQGVTRYQSDHTQGPACAMAAGAATIYRNYFVPLEDQVGQTKTCQINTLQDLSRALGVEQTMPMHNGYALPSVATLEQIHALLLHADEAQRDALRAQLRIGLHWDVEVTAQGAAQDQQVSQAFCSALPVAYSRADLHLWEPFARLVLEAAYEATLWAGVLNAAKHKNPRVYLTMLGGGAFGNHRDWIVQAIVRSLQRFQGVALEVHLVSYGSIAPDLQALAT